MKRSRFSAEQIIAVLREAESGTAVKNLCRRAGISAATFYKWKMKFEGMEISEIRRMRLLVDENSRLKKMVAQREPLRSMQLCIELRPFDSKQ